MALSNKFISQAYKSATARYADLGVDTEAALVELAKIAISLHCWQGDDVGGFENAGGTLGGGIAVTGNYPGKARTAVELRADIEKALSLIPGKHRLNLHAFYGEFGGKKVDRNEIQPKHFQNWIGWAKQNQLGMDFNPTCFSHPKAADGFTLSHADAGIRVVVFGSSILDEDRVSAERQTRRRFIRVFGRKAKQCLADWGLSVFVFPVSNASGPRHAISICCIEAIPSENSLGNRSVDCLSRSGIIIGGPVF